MLSMIRITHIDYGEGNGDDSTIKFETKVIKPRLCEYSDTFILVTRNITATSGNANTKVVFKIFLHLQNA